MKEKLIFIITILILGSCAFAGSYATARYYRIKDISNEQLVERILEFKNVFSKYNIPNSNVKVDRIDEINFYHASFYIEKENIIIYVVINLNEGVAKEMGASIGLNSILDDYDTDKAKFYQLKELSKDKRKKVMKIFESEILDKLGEWSRHY